MPEGPNGFLGANEPTNIFVLAGIITHPDPKLLTHAESSLHACSYPIWTLTVGANLAR